MKLWLQHQHIVIIIIWDNQDLIKHNNNHGQPYSSVRQLSQRAARIFVILIHGLLILQCAFDSVNCRNWDSEVWFHVLDLYTNHPLLSWLMRKHWSRLPKVLIRFTLETRETQITRLIYRDLRWRKLRLKTTVPLRGSVTRHDWHWIEHPKHFVTCHDRPWTS
jgi:hypothetical protein